MFTVAATAATVAVAATTVATTKIGIFIHLDIFRTEEVCFSGGKKFHRVYRKLVIITIEETHVILSEYILHLKYTVS